MSQRRYYKLSKVESERQDYVFFWMGYICHGILQKDTIPKKKRVCKILNEILKDFKQPQLTEKEKDFFDIIDKWIESLAKREVTKPEVIAYRIKNELCVMCGSPNVIKIDMQRKCQDCNYRYAVLKDD